MNKVININFQGRILPIEEIAYETLKQYIESLRVYFANEEGRDEIINDIECRIAELCEERLKKGTVCIAVGDIDLIIASIGRPADFEAQDGFEASASQSGQSTNQNNDQHNDQRTTSGNYSNFDSSNNRPKRLYRDEHNKVLGGVCSGIANYFGIEPLVVRILWFFLIGVNILGYLILWIAVPSTSVKVVGGVRKRLFRDIDNKIIGGVCAGLSKYFGIQVWIVRILFLIPFIRFVVNFQHLHLFQFWDAPDFPNLLDITFSPGAVFVYIVLWLVLPEAKTSADKLEMVGEKVDLNSIKNTIQNDMEGFSKRAQSWGSDIYNRNKGTNHSNEANKSNNEGTATTNNEDANRSTEKRKGLLYYIGRIITLCIKGFVYFILAIVGISLLAALFGIGAAATALLPLRKFLLEDGTQTWSVIGAILLFVWVPIIGIVTAVIRKIAGFKKANVWVRSSFWALWIVGWVMLFYFGSSLGNSFSRHNIPTEQSIALTNPKIDYLEITAAPKMKYYENHWFQMTPFEGYYDEDTVYVRNLKIRIVASKTDSFQVKVVRLSNGKTTQNANELANKINFELNQQDSLVYLDKGIGINKTDKFRNQHIIMTIAVPIGKRIKIANKGWSQTNINGRGIRTGTIERISSDDNWYDEWNESWDNESYSFERGVEYKMTSTGLEKIKRATDEEELDKKDELNSDQPSPIQKELNELKEERKKLQKEVERVAKKGSTIEVEEDKAAKKVSRAASKFSDWHWVLDRFTY